MGDVGEVVEDVFYSIGREASTLGGVITQIVLGAGGLVLLAGGNPLGWVLIAGATLMSISSAYYQYEQAKKAQKRLVTPTGILLNTIKSQIPLPIVYGTCRVGGNIVFLHTEGNNNENLYLVMTLSEGNVEIGNELLIINENPFFKYTKKSNNEWIIDLILTSLTNIRVKIKYKVQITTDDPDYGTYTYWQDREENIEITQNQTLSTTDNYISVFFDTTNNNLVITSNDVNNCYIINAIIYEYSEDNGTTWNKLGNYQGLISYFIDRGNGTGIGDQTIKDYIVNTLGFKIPKDVALLYAKLIYKEGKWQGLPNITVFMKGKNDIYDPRDGTYKFTNNPALILLDYMTSKRYGFGIPLERIDLDSFVDGANYCDRKGLIFDGVITDGRGIDLINLILNHFRGYLVYKNGKFSLRIRDLNQETPVAIITEDDIIEGTFRINMPDISEIPNAITVKYINPEIDYKVDTLTIEDVSVSSIEDRREITLELYGADTYQAKLIGTYFLERARLNLTVSFTVSPEFFNLELGDVFYLYYESYGIEGQLFRIIEILPTPEGLCRITAIIEDLKLYNDQVDLDIYDIDLTIIPNPNDPPGNVTNVTIYEAVEIGSDGTKVNFAVINFDKIPFCEQYEIWESTDNGNTWQLKAIISDPPVKIPILVAKEYRFKIIPISIWGSKLPFNQATQYIEVANNSIYIPYTLTDAIKQMQENIDLNGVQPLMCLNYGVYNNGDNLFSPITLSNKIIIGTVLKTGLANTWLVKYGGKSFKVPYSPYNNEGFYVTPTKIFVTNTSINGFGNINAIDGSGLLKITRGSRAFAKNRDGFVYIDGNFTNQELYIYDENGNILRIINISSLGNNGSYYDLLVYVALWNWSNTFLYIINNYDNTHYYVIDSNLYTATNKPFANNVVGWNRFIQFNDPYVIGYIDSSGNLHKYELLTDTDTTIGTLPSGEALTWSFSFEEILFFGTVDTNNNYHVNYIDLSTNTLTRMI